MSENSGNGEKRAQTNGLGVIGGLAVLTAIEYVVATTMGGSTTILAILAVVKAGMVLQYFMHLPLVLRPDADGGGH